MREFIDVTGKTEEEAIRKALEQLGLDRDDVSVEILERAKSGFLGLGAAPAKVRVRYGEDDEPAPSKPEKKERPVRDTQPEKAEKSDRPEKTERAEKADRPEKTDRPEKAERSEKRDRPRRDRQSRESRPAERPEPKVEAARPVQDLGEEVDDEKAAAIKTFLTGLLAQMESEAAIHVYQPEKGRYKVILEGQGLGALIGRRGETLDAIQQLTSYAVNRTGGRVRVQLDAEGYREKREQSLQHLARKVAAKVTKYHRSVTLEPMNAYERHVIHTALQDVAGVTTYSTGVDPNRRVVVAYDREKQ